jgi:YbbR domain-containing protein
MAVFGMRHLGLKILSIGLAGLLWVLVSGEQLVERSLRVPIEFTNVPKDIELVDEPPPVDVRVRGSSGALGRIAPGELAVVLDLTEARPPQRTYHLTPADLRTPFDVEILHVTPSSVTMRFEQSVSKAVPVLPVVEGEPAAGFAVGTVTAEPAIVQLVGTARALEAVTGAITDPVSVTDSRTTVTRTVTVGSPEPSVRLEKSQLARVTVVIAPAPVEWRIQGVTIQVRNAGPGVEVTPAAVSVVARGAQGTRVSAEAFEASVDVAGMRTGSWEAAVRVVPPPGVGVVSVEPERVKVTIERGRE